MALSVEFTPEQEARVVAAFESQAACEAWLRARLIEHVVAAEQSALQRAALDEQRAAADALRRELT